MPPPPPLPYVLNFTSDPPLSCRPFLLCPLSLPHPSQILVSGDPSKMGVSVFYLVCVCVSDFKGFAKVLIRKTQQNAT